MNTPIEVYVNFGRKMAELENGGASPLRVRDLAREFQKYLYGEWGDDRHAAYVACNTEYREHVLPKGQRRKHRK